jgi:hypothetical protein
MDIGVHSLTAVVVAGFECSIWFDDFCVHIEAGRYGFNVECEERTF